MSALPVRAPRPDEISELLRLLMARGDAAWVHEVEAMIRYRVAWLLAREDPPA